MEQEVTALWGYGVERIQDPDLRRAIAQFLCVVPVNFFLTPASKNGNMHPRWQLGRHGTLRSIIESCVLLPGLARYIPEILDAEHKLSALAVDIALAATLVTDSWKKEDQGDVHYGSAHGRVAAEAWRKFATFQDLDPETVEKVAEASIWHLGVYAPD
jgi:hypothetical protein